MPRQLNIHLVEIDLSAEGIRFRVTPPNRHSSGETINQTTKNFLTQQRAQVAINGSFSIFLGGQTIIKGIVASDGNAYSPFEYPPEEPWPVLNISATNEVSIHNRNSPGGFDVLPTVSLYNALSGSERIVTNGVNTATVFGWGAPTTLQPRTLAGITSDQKLLLATIDGRGAGGSLGMTVFEAADMLIGLGVRDAINLDGGGSTTMAFADPVPRLVNVPSGGERANTTNLAVFARPQQASLGSMLTFADFEKGDESTFSQAPGFSGSTFGINAAASTAVAVSGEGYESGWSQRLAIVDDPNVTGGWFVRHVSGSSASRTQNVIRPTDGYIGFWAKTFDPGVQVSLAIDDTNNTTADRGVTRSLISDGQWHLYQWNLDNDSHWAGWLGGDGLINTADFTIDSLQFFGRDANAVIWIDTISHYTAGPLGQVPEPSTILLAGMSVTAYVVHRGRRRR